MHNFLKFTFLFLTIYHFSLAGSLVDIVGLSIPCDEIRTDRPCPITVKIITKDVQQFSAKKSSLSGEAYLSAFSKENQEFIDEKDMWMNGSGPWGRVILRPFTSLTDTQRVVLNFLPSGIRKSTNVNIGFRISIIGIDSESIEDSKVTTSLFLIRYIPRKNSFSNYPILFVHGLASSDTTWNPIKNYLEKKGFEFGGRFDFCLNYDGTQALNSLNSFDIADLTTSFSLQKGDFYTLNFNVDQNGLMPIPYTFQNSTDVKSNQEAIVKQGRAVSLALKRIVQLTQRQNIILVGHSMGGLALRQYIQNQNEWIESGKNHIAKFVNFDTPHGGSNAGTLSGPLFGYMKSIDVYSNAVRDMRKTYSNANETPGVFLNGGNESDIYAFGSYYSKDVNCNMSSIDKITGLNQMDFPLTFPTIGIISTYPETPIDPVEIQDANINNFYSGTISNNYFTPVTHIDIHRTDLDMIFNAIETPNYVANPNVVELIKDSSGYSSDILPMFSNIQISNPTLGYSTPIGFDTDYVNIIIPENGELHLSILNNISPWRAFKLYDKPNSIVLYKFGLFNKETIDTSIMVSPGVYKFFLETYPDIASHRAPILVKFSLNTFTTSISRNTTDGINNTKYLFDIQKRGESIIFTTNPKLSGKLVVTRYGFDGRVQKILFNDFVSIGTQKIAINCGMAMGKILKIDFNKSVRYLIN